jgi:NitT/TauT family transport system substrate-binding protein
MKRKLKVLTALLVSSVTAISMFGCNNSKSNENSNVTVRLNEVTRSVFYAPMYIAMSEGFFSDNGIEIDLQTGQAP